MWAVTVISLIGTILNIKKNNLCFYIWLITDIVWLLFDFHTGVYSRALLDLVQVCFAAWGAYEWSIKGKTNF